VEKGGVSPPFLFREEAKDGDVQKLYSLTLINFGHMNKKTALIISFGVIILALLFSGRFFGSIPQGLSSTSSGSTRAAIGAAGELPRERGTVPDFNLEKLGGGTLTLSQFRGEKFVILDFFATWCPNCRRDMPKLNRWYQKYKDQVEVIGVNLQENKNTVRKYISSTGITFPIVFDPFGQTSQNYAVRYTNIHVLIDKEGRLVQTISGDIREADIISLIQ